MIHLFANVYLRPFETGLLDKEHLYIFKTESFGFPVGIFNTAVVQPVPLPPEATIRDCVEYSLNNNDVRVVVYTAPEEFKQILSGFVKNVGLGDYDQVVNTYKEWYRKNWESFYAYDVNVPDKDLTFQEFEEKYFSDFPSLEDAVSLGCDNEHLGIEWKLFDYIKGNKKVSGLKEKLVYLAKQSFASELHSIKLSLESISYLVGQDWLELSDEGFYSKLDPIVNDENITKSSPSADYYIKKYGFGRIPRVRGIPAGCKFKVQSERHICDRIMETGKFPTYTEILRDVTGPNSLGALKELRDRMYANLDIIELAKKS